MKKTLLLGVLLAAGFGANAQIADGSNAPQISGQRIVSIEGTTVTYGEDISLQDYLDAGKTVIVDLSAAWCAPCWGFHNSHTLEDFYAAYGPEGSDELRVIFVEADPSTNILEIDGQSLPPENGMAERGPSQGDWLAGTTYPVINNNDASDDYNLEGFPSVYVIVPTTPGAPGKVYNLERDNLGAMVAAINAARGSQMVGVDNWGRIQAVPARHCDATAPVTALVQGFGHDVTSVEAQLKKDGVVVATETFNLDLQAFAYGEITFTGINAEATADYQAVLTKVNGAAALNTIPANNTSEEYSVIPSASVESYKNVEVTITTDEYPNEMKLYIIYYNEAGEALIKWQTPTYSNTTANKEKTFKYYPPAFDPNVCYGIVMQDLAGDGWDYNTAGSATPTEPYGAAIKSNNVTIFTNNGAIGSQFWQDATFKTNNLLDSEKFDASAFAVYPNPSNGIFNFTTEETIDVTVVDLTGKTVHTAKAIENGGSINLSGLAKGMYIAKISSASGERNEKLIIK